MRDYSHSSTQGEAIVAASDGDEVGETGEGDEVGEGMRWVRVMGEEGERDLSFQLFYGRWLKAL